MTATNTSGLPETPPRTVYLNTARRTALRKLLAGMPAANERGKSAAEAARVLEGLHRIAISLSRLGAGRLAGETAAAWGEIFAEAKAR